MKYRQDEGSPEWSSRRPRRANGTNPRAAGRNPRAKRDNPRAKGENPRARLGTDAAFSERVLRRALARHRVRTGEPWCDECDDTGWTTPDDRGAIPCPAHRPMTLADADLILHPD